MKKLVLRDIIFIFLGFSLATMLWRYPMLLFFVIIVISASLYVMRDKIDWTKLKVEFRKRKLEVCPECGSATKHYKSCSQYGKLRGKT